MTLLGIDLNATRARVSAGPARDYPRAVTLDRPHEELALAVGLLGGGAAVGVRALRRCRLSPHLVRTGFLPSLGEADRQVGCSLDAARALALMCACLANRCGGAERGVLAVPAYLSASQVGRVAEAARAAGLLRLSAVRGPLGLALSAHAEHPWTGAAVVIDVDDHALTLAAASAAGEQLRLTEVRALAGLGLRAWRERLLNGLADRCILQSRRDPRDSPAAEQFLFDRLGAVLDACRQDRPARVALEAPGWFQSLSLRPEDVRAICAPLSRLALAAARDACVHAAGPVFVSADAARLPGLLDGLRASCEAWCGAALAAGEGAGNHGEDFGEGLLEEEDEAAVVVLAADAASRAAHGLAPYLDRAGRGAVCVDAAPLPLPQPAEAGPARLRYRGEEYPLNRARFTVGRQPFCDLAFDGDAYPTVAPRHCEIVWADGRFTVWDQGRLSTLVNDGEIGEFAVLEPGDSIRLGPDGPQLRFLGHALPRTCG